MPQQLETFEFGLGRGKQNVYDYSVLFNGAIWKCIPGEDFPEKVAPQGFAGRLYKAARDRGLRCKCSKQDDGTVIIQAFHWDGLTPADRPRPAGGPEQEATTDASLDASAA